MWKMTIAFTVPSGSLFWSRHVLLSRPKLQNKLTETFSAAVTRHKQQTSGPLWTANYIVYNSERFFKFVALASVSFHQSCPSFHGMPSIDNTNHQVLWAENVSSDLHCNDSPHLLSLATSANAHLMSILSIMNTIWQLQFFFKITATYKP